MTCPRCLKADRADIHTCQATPYAHKLEQERDNAKQLVKEICAEWHEDCEPCCDSYGHDENCRAVNIAAAKRAMQDEIKRLRTAEQHALSVVRAQQETEDKLRAELAEWKASPVLARMHPDDRRIVRESTYAHAAESGGESWSSVSGYTIKLIEARKGEGE